MTFKNPGTPHSDRRSKPNQDEFQLTAISKTPSAE